MTDERPRDRSAPPAGSLPRAARLLGAVARGGEAGASLMDLVSWTSLPRTTIHRVMAMLGDLGLVERAADARWYLGREIFCLGLTAALHHPVARIAQTDLARLVEATGRAGFVMVRSGLDAVCVLRLDRHGGTHPVVHQIGSRAPLGLGAGSLALLAALPAPEAAAIVAANRPRFRALARYDEAAFRAALRAARAGGLAVHADLFVPGLSGIGVAVPGPGGHPLAALSLALPTPALGPASQARIERALRTAAARLSRRLLPGG